MNKKVIEIVRKYVEEHLDKSDPKQEFDVFVVWHIVFAIFVITRISVSTIER